MTQQNISTCIAPGLIRGEDQDIATIFRDAPNANGIVQLMIERFPYMFSVDVSEDERQCKRFFSNGEEEEEFESDGNDKQGDDNGNDKQQETNNNNNNKNSNLDSDDDKTFRRKSTHTHPTNPLTLYSLFLSLSLSLHVFSRQK
eukprot:TRINITY_DN458_c0_g1_i10.p2 TRINITY_DN458_c0_g1~~TRINITY_DN458_c0_g1_i10.p2  ORF type:complete len:144 (+),score=46.96 TRINITY_DN458_c0_g1_i10:456-887(+)